LAGKAFGFNGFSPEKPWRAGEEFPSANVWRIQRIIPPSFSPTEVIKNKIKY
jgi:hypothetical protein